MAGIDKELVRRARKQGGSAYVLEQGPPTVSYHNPKTGQEFPGLPKDPWSLEKYMLKGWLPGRASEQLRQRWEEIKRTLEDPADAPEFQAAASKMLAETEREARSLAVDDRVFKLIETLTEKVASLEASLRGHPPARETERTEEARAEPMQLAMDLGI